MGLNELAIVQTVLFTIFALVLGFSCVASVKLARETSEQISRIEHTACPGDFWLHDNQNGCHVNLTRALMRHQHLLIQAPDQTSDPVRLSVSLQPRSSVEGRWTTVGTGQPITLNTVPAQKSPGNRETEPNLVAK